MQQSIHQPSPKRDAVLPSPEGVLANIIEAAELLVGCPDHEVADKSSSKPHKAYFVVEEMTALMRAAITSVETAGRQDEPLFSAWLPDAKKIVQSIGLKA